MSNNPTAMVPFLLQRIVPAIKASGNADAEQAFQELFKIIMTAHTHLIPLVESARVTDALDAWAKSNTGDYVCGPATGSNGIMRCALVCSGTMLEKEAPTMREARSLIVEAIEAGEA